MEFDCNQQEFQAMKIETNLDESLIEDLSQRSTRDTAVPVETASGEGAVPKSTVQSTTTTYVSEVDGKLMENQAHALKEEASQPGLALAAGQYGILQAGCASFMLCYCAGIKYSRLIILVQCKFVD